MLARRFLWLVAAAIVVVIAAAIVYRLFGRQLLAAALVPPGSFAASPAAPPPDYARLAAWDAHPALPGDPTRWLPPGVPPTTGPAAVFFVTPTAYLGRSRWTMPFDDAATNRRVALYLRNEASVFTGAGRVWAPKYRQATFGAFLTTRPDAAKALDFAYADVERAFAAFVAAVPPGVPIILAGHSQGARHLLRLVADHIAGTPLADRVVAVYAIGWPVTATDLAAMRLPGCATASATHCVVSWRSYAEPAEVSDYRTADPAAMRSAAPLLCVNPLIGAVGGSAPAAANRGSLVPGKGDEGGRLVARGIGAACRATYLSIGDPPGAFDRYVLPGNNFHVYDYNLFWANVRADSERRVASWGLGHPVRDTARPGAGDGRARRAAPAGG